MTVRTPHNLPRRVSLHLQRPFIQRHRRRLLAAAVSIGLLISLSTAAIPAQAAPGSGATTPGTGTVVPLGAFPVQGPCTFTDTWGASRSGGRAHEGVDLIAKSGLNVYAAVAGTLSKQAVDKPGGLSGNAWWLTTSDGSYFFYAHLSGFAPDLKVGSKVVAGQIIGYVGMTGNAAAPHLHFEIHPGGGSAINPTPSVKAVDGCKITTPLPQPGDPPPADPSAPSTTTTTTTTAPPNAVTNTSDGSSWTFISPQTAFDSAWATGRVTGKRTIKVSALTGVGNTPGVLTRITASNAAAAGFLIVHPCTTDGAGVASLTFPAGATAVGTAPVEVVSGNICVTTNVGVNLKIDILAVRSTSGVGLRPIPATRALDTRSTGTRLAPGVEIPISADALGVVPGTQALSATISLVDPTAAGSITIGLCSSGSWTVPTSSDQLSSFAIVMRVTSTGWCLKSTITTDVIVDVTGIWTGTTGPIPIPATRVLDSRTSIGQIGPNPITIQVAGQGTIPAGTSAVMLALTTVAGDGQAIVFATPCGQPHGTGVVTATNPNRITTVIVPAALNNGTLCISAIQPTHIIIDVLAAGGSPGISSSSGPDPAPTTTTPPPTTANPVLTTPEAATPAPTNAASGAAVGSADGRWTFISPQTAFDSAWATGRVTGKRTIKVSALTGVGNTPGVLTRITASNAAAAGFLIVHPCTTDGAGVASLTFPAGATAVGTAPVEVVSGNICVTTNVGVNLKIDILAVRSTSGVGLRPIPATRALDTRSTGTRLAPGVEIPISADALGVVPGTQALSATISLVDPTAAGSITIGLCSSGSWTVPTSSDQLSSFAIVMRVTSTGWCLKSTITTDVIVDVTGIWTGTTGPIPIPATRVLDSRTSIGQIGPNPITIQVAGQGTIPAGTSAVMLALTTVAGDGQAIVFATPCGQPHGTGVVTATNPNRITTVIVPAALNNGTLCISAIQPTHIIIDVLAAG